MTRAKKHVRLRKEAAGVTAIKKRAGTQPILWLTGNVGAGKTSLAYLLKERLGAIVLDGDELRASISTDLGFSTKDREAHNLRVARLAQVLNRQGHIVAVAVIAPYRSTRAKIDKLIHPYWIYIKGGKVGKTMPYEPPRNPDCTINPTEESLMQSLEKIIREVRALKKR